MTVYTITHDGKLKVTRDWEGQEPVWDEVKTPGGVEDFAIGLSGSGEIQMGNGEIYRCDDLMADEPIWYLVKVPEAQSGDD